MADSKRGRGREQGLSIINGRFRPKSELLMGEQHADARLQQ